MGHALWTVHALWNVWTVVMAAMHSPATSASGDHLKEYKNGSQQKYSFDEPNAMKVDSAMSFFNRGRGRRGAMENVFGSENRTTQACASLTLLAVSGERLTL